MKLIFKLIAGPASSLTEAIPAAESLESANDAREPEHAGKGAGR